MTSELEKNSSSSEASHGQSHFECSLRQIGAINISSLSRPKVGRGSFNKIRRLHVCVTGMPARKTGSSRERKTDRQRKDYECESK